MLKRVTQLSAFRFCKTSKIPFDFKLPADQILQNSNASTQSSQKGIKMIKMKRSGRSLTNMKKLENEERQQFQSLLPSQKRYYQSRKNQIAKNIKDQNFYNAQYKRGEDLIDNVPIDPYYSYKVADYMKIVEEKSQNIDQLRYPNIGENKNIVHNLEDVIETYQEKHGEYELQKFEKYLSQYPGSTKGSLPQDDPQSYIDYANKKLTPFISAQLKLMSQNSRKTLIQRKQNKEDNNSIIPRSSSQLNKSSSTIECTTLLSLMAKERKFQLPSPEEVVEAKRKIQLQLLEGSLIDSFSEVPFIPNIPFQEYHEWMNKMLLWVTFRQFYDKKNMKEVTNDLYEKLKKLQTEEQTQEWHEIQAAPSLYPYFMTLPKQIRQKNTVKTVFLGLEFRQPDLSYVEKEKLLNQAAFSGLPLDPVSQFMMKTYLQNMKYYPTKEQVAFVYNLSAQKTWDRDVFAAASRQERLRKLLSGIPDTKYTQPPAYHKRTDKDLAQLPVDYYDEDGFWDELRQQKLNRHQKSRPMLKGRRYLHH